MLIQNQEQILKGYAHNLFYTATKGDGEAQYSHVQINTDARLGRFFIETNNYEEDGIFKTSIDPDSLVVTSVFSQDPWPRGQFLGFKNLNNGYQQNQLEALNNVAVMGSGLNNGRPANEAFINCRRGVAKNQYNTDDFINKTIQMAQHVVGFYNGNQPPHIVSLVNYLNFYINDGLANIKEFLLESAADQVLMDFDKIFQICASNEAVDLAAFYKPLYLYLLKLQLNVIKRTTLRYNIKYIIRKARRGRPVFIHKKIDDVDVTANYFIPYSIWRNAVADFMNAYDQATSGNNLATNVNENAVVTAVSNALFNLYNADQTHNIERNITNTNEAEAILDAFEWGDFIRKSSMRLLIDPAQYDKNFNFSRNTVQVFNKMLIFINAINHALDNFNVTPLPPGFPVIQTPTVNITPNYWTITSVQARVRTVLAPQMPPNHPNIQFPGVFQRHIEEMRRNGYLDLPYTKTVLWAFQRGMLVMNVNTLATVQPNQQLLSVTELKEPTDTDHPDYENDEKTKNYITYLSDWKEDSAYEKYQNEFNWRYKKEKEIAPATRYQRIADWGSPRDRYHYFKKMVLLRKMPKNFMNYEIYRTVIAGANNVAFCRRINYSLLAMALYLNGAYNVIVVPYFFYTPKAHGVFPTYHDLFF